ncbi:SURF1-like protein [Nocardiopsis terrae]|uniref:SURF1-like protein n=1 Tax=Nocardiopsis terrae TaxID=372655 RepID=A0ABR9H9U4_9ACTN|nr:SURF1 family protein [Nocardiopsis terrae]MBE1455802.1 cytochrome oxidase assembly protein ShyY1 [Nocardiopsis terrae]GHC92601.1 SURF1-like protein [Nocardiopsis terrae]
MLKVLFSSRMTAFHAMVVVLVPAFVWLGFWQLDRAEMRSAAVDLQRDNVAADPVPVGELASVGGDVDPADRWRTVEATGTWDPEHEVLLRNRDGSRGVGFHVLTPLVTEDGTGLLVNRGWIERGENAKDTPDAPPLPEGTVEVTGRLQFGETEENTGLHNREGMPEGQIMFVDVDMLAEELPYPIYGGYVELTGQDPVPDPAPERVALQEEDTGMSASYAVQWWVFAVVAVVGWVVLIRRELRDARSGAAGGEAGAEGGDRRSGGEPGAGAAHGNGDTGEGPEEGPAPAEEGPGRTRA